VLGVLIEQGGMVVAPLFVRDIFNLLSSAGPSPEVMPQLFTLVGLSALASIVGWTGGRLQMVLGLRVIANVMADLTKKAFANLMRHSHHYFASSFSGALTRRVSRFSGAYENLYYSIITILFETGLYIVGITFVLALHNVVLGAVVAFWVVLFVAVQYTLSRWQQPLRLARAEADTNTTAVLADAISNQNTVALFAANPYEESLLGSAADKLKAAVIRLWNVDAVVFGVQGLLGIAVNISVLWLSIFYWQQGALTVGDVLLVQVYIMGAFGKVWGLGRQFRVINNSLADASEMVAILETPLEVKDKHGAKGLKIKKGEIWFDDVSFHFHKESPVLTELNLRVAGGEKIALVGPSGAGKSTVTKLLLRLYDVERGAIKIDAQDIAAITQDSLREHIAFVPQEPILFHRSLLDNIRYGRREATDQEVVEAAKKAHCHEFISKLPLQYEAFVGERGIKLSGGERQRVAIARAILKNAPILVLDEATSSLDSESEMLIQDALAVLMQGKTVVVIAHRLSTIMKMDRIIVIDAGTVVAEGTHLELINQEGLYKKLWSIQAGGFLGEEV